MSNEPTLDFRLLEAEMQVSVIKEYFKIIETGFAEGELAARRKRDEGLKALTLHDDYEYEAQMLNHEYDYRVEILLPRIYYDPFIFAIYAVYESVVREIHGLLQKHLNQDNCLNTRQDDFLRRVRQCFETHLQFGLLHREEHFTRLQALRTIRNIIAHWSGRVDLASKSQQEVVWNEGLGDFIGLILVKRGFVEEMFGVVTEELEALIARYKESVP